MSTTSKWMWPFELQEKIGEGGMGVVYRARFVKNDRQVAVKLLPEEVLKNQIVASRFKREMEALKTLKHPNIVNCFGGVCQDDRHFYAMELVEGGTLEELLQRRGRLPWEQVIEYGLQICAALAFAHQHGIIHRDVKPGNFLLDRDGTLKLSDFGIALATSSAKLTADGTTVGTYHYMAPEQIRGEQVTEKTDLYAVGCVLFEMLTGRTPFEGSAPVELLHQHLKKPAPRVATLAMDCPAALDQLIAQLLEKDPAYRPVSAADVASTLRGITQTTQASIDQPAAILSAPRADTGTFAWREKRRWHWGMTAVLMIATGLLSWGIASSRQKPPENRGRELWVQALRHSDKTVRIEAANALGEITADPAHSVEALSAALSDPEAQVRQAAVQALGKHGYEARPALQSLIRLRTHDPDGAVRSYATSASQAIENSEPPARTRWPVTLGIVLLLLLGVAALGREFIRRIPIPDDAR